MSALRAGTVAIGSSQQAGRQLAHAVLPLLCARHIALVSASATPSSAAGFSTSTAAQMRDIFPARETKHIRQTPPVWPHHGYTYEEMLAVKPVHRAPKTVGDRFAWRLMRMCRWGMDTATGMRQTAKPIASSSMPGPADGTTKGAAATTVTRKKAKTKPLTEAQWMIRFIFLESIAGVPGMVAGMLRHLQSIRRLRRDNGWIETLLEESYNERMHLMTFMKMCEPGWFMKMMILGAQGVYFNTMFLCYLLSPRVCHRFVGYLEEEAVHTYTQCLAEIDAGHTPMWTDPRFRVPEIAVRYWNMPEDQQTMRDLILYIRADEATHRGVNHTLGNLNQDQDPNPFVSEYKSGGPAPDPLKAPAGFEREQVL